MPGVPHPPHDGFAGIVGNLRTGLANIGQQQSYPDVLFSPPADSYTITSAALASLPSPGPVKTGTSNPINASVSLSFLVGLSAVCSIPFASGGGVADFTGEVGFTINSVAPSPYYPMQMSVNVVTISGTNYIFPIDIMLSSTWLVTSPNNTVSPIGIACSGIVPGGNTFEIVAATGVASQFILSGITLWALPI